MCFFFFQAEDGIRDSSVTGVQTCALPISPCSIFIGMHARKNEELRKLALAWLGVGLTEVVPAYVAYFKAWGFWNNLTIVDSWIAIPVLGVLWHGAQRGDESNERSCVARSQAACSH